MTRLFENFKEREAKEPEKDFRLEIAQDFEKLKAESKAYWYLKKRLTDLQTVAHYQVMSLAGEPIAQYWKGQLHILDEILSIEKECEMKANEVNAEVKLRSVV